MCNSLWPKRASRLRLARAEVDRAILTFKTAAEEVTRLGGETIPLDLTEGNEGRWGLVQRFPVGPVLAITPSNFPLNLVAHKLAPAMAAGCPIILKPAPQTPFTALALGEIVLKAGWPQEAIAVLPLSNADTAWMVEKEDRIKLVSFTGSSRVGWEIKAHSNRKRMVLELGSNAALIVHGDWPDLDDAALRTAHAAFGNAGQSCISVQRVFVERSVFQTYLWKVVECAARLVVGNPADEATDVGPLIRAAEAERVESWTEAGGVLRNSREDEGVPGAVTLQGGTVADILPADEGIAPPQMGGARTGSANALAAREARKNTRFEDMFAAKAKNLVKGAGHVMNNGVPLSEASHGGEIMTRQYDAITLTKSATIDGHQNTDDVVAAIRDDFWNHPKAGAMKFMANRDSMVRKNFTATNLGGSGTPYGLVPFDLLAPSRLIYPVYTLSVSWAA